MQTFKTDMQPDESIEDKKERDKEFKERFRRAKNRFEEGRYRQMTAQKLEKRRP